LSVLVSIGLVEFAFGCPIPQNKSILMQNDVAAFFDPGHVKFDPERQATDRKLVHVLVMSVDSSVKFPSMLLQR